MKRKNKRSKRDSSTAKEAARPRVAKAAPREAARLAARTEGGKRRFAASLAGIALETGLSKSSVQNAVRQLTRRRQLIAVTREGPTSPPIYEVLTPWIR